MSRAAGGPIYNQPKHRRPHTHRAILAEQQMKTHSDHTDAEDDLGFLWWKKKNRNSTSVLQKLSEILEVPLAQQCIQKNSFYV